MRRLCGVNGQGRDAKHKSCNRKADSGDGSSRSDRKWHHRGETAKTVQVGSSTKACLLVALCPQVQHRGQPLCQVTVERRVVCSSKGTTTLIEVFIISSLFKKVFIIGS